MRSTRSGLMLLALWAAGCTGDSGDQFPPTVQFTNPQNGAVVTGVVNIGVNATDDTGIELVEFRVGNTLLGEDEIAPFSWLWNTGGMAPGQYQLVAVAWDRAGKSAEARITVTVQ